jgi:hypothetical protein
MSPRGANFKRGTATRARDDELIRQRSRHRMVRQPSQPDPADDDGPSENPDLRATKAERGSAVWEWRRLRAEFWQRPIVVDGVLTAAELPPEYTLLWEDRAAVIEHEQPSYDGWRIERTEHGTLLIAPGKLPELLPPE